MVTFGKLQEIKNKDDFVGFLRAMSEDFVNAPEEWANGDIPSFLEAMAAWVEDRSGSPFDDTDYNKTDYNAIARIIYMGKLYE